MVSVYDLDAEFSTKKRKWLRINSNETLEFTPWLRLSHMTQHFDLLRHESVVFICHYHVAFGFGNIFKDISFVR